MHGYAIQNGGAWVQASSNAAAERATVNNGGSVISPGNLAKLPDATLVGFGVRRLDRPSQSPPNTYMNASPGAITPTGDRATQAWAYADMQLEQAQQQCSVDIVTRAETERRTGVALQGHRFETDAESVSRYGLVGSALGAGVPYPAGGIPFRCTQVSDETSKRIRLNAAQFSAVIQAVATLMVQVADTEDTLLTLAETAVDIDAVRAIDIDVAWPT